MENKKTELTFTLKVQEKSFTLESGETIKYLDCFVDCNGEQIKFKPIPNHKELFKFICKNIK